MTDELFRREVLDEKRDGLAGGLSLAQPIRLWTLTSFMATVAIALIGFIVLGGYSRRTQVTGKLVPDLGVATVVAPISGVVGRTLLAEGETAESGAGLLQIDASRSTADGQDAFASIRIGVDSREVSLAEIAQSQVAQLDAQMVGVNSQLSVAKEEMRQVERAKDTRREQVRLARKAVERYRGMAGEKFVSQLEIDQQEQALLEHVNQQHALERQTTSIRREIMRLQQTLRELPVLRLAQLASAKRDASLIHQERVLQEASNGLLVRAPVAGVIASRMVEPGQAVQAGQPLLSLLPKGSALEAQLLVPSRAIGFVSPGSKVLLRYQAFPYQKFGHHVGRIKRISRNAISAAASDGLPFEALAVETYYRVLVELEDQTVTAYGMRQPLRAGMLLDADILGERRRLYEWLFEPLYSVRGRLASSGKLER
ncbi:HlyD family efflux transporter periplasmic adaptor subunit [Stenotrophomonas sp.]|uniref:HlyD family secretion protein n=1 Tax=Stenotrophomonas sp. TaxID=69392 RepID=UPI0028962FA0|nr:HlyD family efflux transporter periplasmic adaptor subunit [Stenotrophomonas sp.]